MLLLSCVWMNSPILTHEAANHNEGLVECPVAVCEARPGPGSWSGITNGGSAPTSGLR